MTAYRYVGEAIEVLAALAPRLETMMRGRAVSQVTILDGTIVDRGYHAGALREQSQEVVRIPKEDLRREPAGAN